MKGASFGNETTKRESKRTEAATMVPGSFNQNIKLQVHYMPIYLHSYYKKNFHFKVNDFPVSNNFYKKEISLPIYYNLKKKEIFKVIKVIEKICDKNLK